MMKKQKPNILWLTTDEQRCDSLGCYGSRWAHTPNIDALAQEGVVFETAVTPAPVCLPARTSMLAARYPSQTDVWHNQVDPRTPVANLMGAFRAAGYRAASFGKQHHAGAGSAFEIESGPCLSAHVDYFHYAKQYDETRYNVVKYPGKNRNCNWILGGRFPAPAEETAEAQVVKRAMQWLEANPSGTPFFLQISFNGPHTPVVPPEPFDRIINPDSISFPHQTESLPAACPRWLSEKLVKYAGSSALSPAQIRRMRQCYYGEAAFLDSLFGEFLGWMKERGLRDNCIVVYWSDHGAHLGDYGLVQKQTFFEPVVNVPFIFRYPEKIAAGVRFRVPVETQSMLPTLLELAGLEPPGAGYSPSLAPSLLSGKEPETRPIFSEFVLDCACAPQIRHEGRLIMVRRGGWKMSVCLDPQIHDPALYNLKDDPYERVNSADDPRYGAQRRELLGLIKEHIEGENKCRRADRS